MLSVYVWQPGSPPRTGGSELLDSPGFKWVDVTAPTAEVLAPLAKHFSLHPLEVEDCLHLDQRPKLEEYPGHQFVVLHGFTAGPKDVTRVTLHELHCFLSDGWLLTVHQKEHPALDSVRARVLGDIALTQGRGPDFVLYVLADALVDADFGLLDRFNDALDELEQAMIQKPTPTHLRRTFALRRSLVKLRSVLSPQRDVVALLSRSGIQHVDPKTSLYFRDVYDHLTRIYEQIDNARDMLGNILDLYLSVMANRTNDTTKQLTIFASIFLPMSFVVGFFGQNFQQLSKDVYLYPVLASLVGTLVAMLLWYKKKGWL